MTRSACDRLRSVASRAFRHSAATTWNSVPFNIRNCDTINLKTSTLVYRSLAGTAPVYLADKCTLVTAAGRRPLRSADNRTCLVNGSRNQFSDHCFATARPTLWNSLPEQLRQPDITFGQFIENVYVWVNWTAAPCV